MAVTSHKSFMRASGVMMGCTSYKCKTFKCKTEGSDLSGRRVRITVLGRLRV